VSRRARTLTVLRRAGRREKGDVLQFLYEARLIGGIKEFETVGNSEFGRGGPGRGGPAKANLQGAQLQGAYLFKAELWRADLRWASLAMVALSEAKPARGEPGRGRPARGTSGGDRPAKRRIWKGRPARGESPRTILHGAQLQGADLRKARLIRVREKVDLITAQAHLEGANLSGADLTDLRKFILKTCTSLFSGRRETPFDMAPPAPEVGCERAERWAISEKTANTRV